MNNNSQMLGIVRSILLESTLNDIFSNIKINDKISVRTIEGSKHSYQVISNMVNKVIMKDLAEGSGGVKYIMDKTSLEGNKLTLWKYDSNAQANDFKGDEINIEINKIGIINDKTGNFDKIEIDGDLEKELNHQEFIDDIPNFNKILKDSEKGDIIAISTETFIDDDSEDTMVNTLFLKVNGIRNDTFRFRFEDIQGGAENEITNNMKQISNIINDFYIFIGGKAGYFKKIGDTVGVDLVYRDGNKSKSIRLNGVINVENNSIESDFDYDKSDKKYSKKELQQALMKDKTFQELLQKKPSFIDTLRGASPVGLIQLKNLMDKYKVKTSYLTKGKHIKFKLLSPTIRSNDMRYKLLNIDGYYYEAKVTDENTIKMGSRGRSNWEINLKNEVETNTYKAEVIFCQSDSSCKTLTKKAIIKILTND